MIKTISTEKKPIKLWLEDIDHDTLEQAKNLANLPFLHHHLAIMPDAHVGYGMPIGGVAATKDVIIPNAVGVDIDLDDLGVLGPVVDAVTRQCREWVQARAEREYDVGLGDQFHACLGAVVTQRTGGQRV